MIKLILYCSLLSSSSIASNLLDYRKETQFIFLFLASHKAQHTTAQSDSLWFGRCRGKGDEKNEKYIFISIATCSPRDNTADFRITLMWNCVNAIARLFNLGVFELSSQGINIRLQSGNLSFALFNWLVRFIASSLRLLDVVNLLFSIRRTVR